MPRGERAASATLAVGTVGFGRLTRFLRAVTAGVLSGILDTEPTQYSIRDEPLPVHVETDWDRALDLALHRRDAERERLERIDNKIAILIAGTIAGLGLFVDKAAGWLDYVLGALLLIPLKMLLEAFRTHLHDDLPNLAELVRTYERYPKGYIRAVVHGAAKALSATTELINKKAENLNKAMEALFWVTVAILVLRACEALANEALIQGFFQHWWNSVTQHAPVPTPTMVKSAKP